MVGRVNLYHEEFDTLIDNRGLWCDWYRASVCSCVTRDSGQPDFDCPICHGSGYRYLAPKRIKIAVTSLSAQEMQLKTLEVREAGTSYVTPKSDVIMGYRDRLVFSDLKCIMSEVVHWDNAIRGVSPRTYRNIKDVVSLADGEYEYELGVDFEITEDNYHLRWLKNNYIPNLDNKNMSLLYYTTPSYYVVDLLHELRATLSDRKSDGIRFVELPKQYKIQREDFIYGIKQPDAVTDTPTDSTTEQPTETIKTNGNWSDEGDVVSV